MPLSTALIVAGVLVIAALVAGLSWRALDGRRRSGAGQSIGLAELGVGSLAPA